MEYQDLSQKELIEEIERLKLELQEARDMLQAIQKGEIDALVVQHGDTEKIYVLEDSNVTYRKLIEEMNEGAVTFNPDCSVLYCNKAFAEVLGYSVSTILSLSIIQLVNVKERTKFRDLINSTGRKPARFSFNMRKKTGKNIPMSVSLHKVEIAGMEIFLMTVTDVRDKLSIKKLADHQKELENLARNLMVAKEKAEQAVALLREKNIDYSILNDEYININNILAKTNEELLVAKKKAEKSDQLKSAFIANMSHEIRTPLNSILGYTKMLLDTVSDEQQKRHIEVIIRSGKHLLHLINDIVDISRLESGEMKIVDSEVWLNRMMQELKRQFHAYALNKDKQHLEFRLKIPEEWSGDPVIVTDEFRVRQVLNNILSNALKYTDRGFIEFGYNICKSSSEVRFFVRDTGAGISQEDLEVIFNRFEQGAKPPKDVISGTGLGLAISKGLAELLEGRIWVKSKPGAGSTFYFAIPFKETKKRPVSKPVEGKPPAPGIPVFSGKRILLSEDDMFSRELMVHLLKKTEAELIIATDGRQTLDLFRKNPVDLVLLDLRMPEINGYQVLEHIRMERPDTIVIAQTAYAMLDDIRKFEEVGFDDYLLKPVNDNELYHKLSKYLADY
jgi:PAS domain S-box-containing protein